MCCVWFLSVISWIICFLSHQKIFIYFFIALAPKHLPFFPFSFTVLLQTLKKSEEASEQRFRSFKLFTFMIFKERDTDCITLWSRHHILALVVLTGKVKTDEVKKVPESASWLAKSKNFDLILSQLQMLLFKSWVTLICPKNRGGVLHIFLLWPVTKLGFDAKIKPAGLSLPLTCHRSSLLQKVVSSTFWSLTRCKTRKDLMQGVDIPVTVSCQLSLPWHKAWAWILAGALHRWAPCTG